MRPRVRDTKIRDRRVAEKAGFIFEGITSCRGE